MKFKKIMLVASGVFLAIVVVVTLWLTQSGVDENPPAVPAMAEKAALRAAELKCKERLGDGCSSQSISKQSAVWAYYDSAKGYVGQYIYEINDYTITVYLNYDRSVDQVYMERIPGFNPGKTETLHNINSE